MEALSPNTRCDDEARALKSLVDTFGSMLSNGWVKGETSSKLSEKNALNNSSYTNGNSDDKSRLKRGSFSGGSVGKEYVWRAKAASDGNPVGEAVNGKPKSSFVEDNAFDNSCCANRVDESKSTRMKTNPSYTVGASWGYGKEPKDYVWRVRGSQDSDPKTEVPSVLETNPSPDLAYGSNSRVETETSPDLGDGSSGTIKSETSSQSYGENGNSSHPDGNTVGEAINGKLESSFVEDNAFDSSCCANRVDESKSTRMKTNPSYTVGASWGYGKEPKDYVWRVRGTQDSDPKTEVLRVMETNPSPDLAYGSYSRVKIETSPDLGDGSSSTVKSETSSQSSGGNGDSSHPEGNSNYTQSRLRVNHASMGTLSSGLGKGYVWRPRKGKDVHASNPGLDSETCSNNGSCFGDGLHDSQAYKLKRNPFSMGNASGGVGKDFVWRVRTKGTSTETKPLTEEANESLGSTCSPGPGTSNAKSGSNKEFEDFLLDTLGLGFQLERSIVKEVLGNCGYDMKKSLETILDLVAVNLDRRIDLNKRTNSSISETRPSHNQRGRRTMKSNGISRQSDESANAFFRVPVGPNSTLSTSVSESTKGSSEVFGTVLTVPQEDVAEEFNITKQVKLFGCESVLQDEAEEESYQILRKTVKEFRDTTKEYYKAAAEAFASGDHAQASILLEKGQFFYNKAREADEESAQKILEFRSRGGETQDDMCLDLQDHNAKEAIRLLKCHLRSLSGILSIKNLKIIFGVGDLEVEKRKRAVIKLLEKEAIEWTADEDSGMISIRLDRINPKSLSFTENSKAV